MFHVFITQKRMMKLNLALVVLSFFILSSLVLTSSHACQAQASSPNPITHPRHSGQNPLNHDDGSSDAEGFYFSPSHNVKFEHLTDAHGLSQNAVFCILQDRKGFMWLGAQDGLNRYDGYTFKVFRHDPDDSTSISDNFVTAIYEDHQGVLWVGTHAGGLNRFDRFTERFVCYRHDPSNPASLSHDRVNVIAEDPSGALWVGTDHGLNRLDRTTGLFTRFIHEPQNPDSLGRNYVSSLCVDHTGGLWVGSADGLFHYDHNTNSFTRFAHNPGNPNSLSHNMVRTIFEDKRRTLWVGAAYGGLNKLLPAANSAEKLGKSGDRDPHAVRFKRYQCEAYNITEDDDGNLWIGSRGSGLFQFDPEKERLTQFLNVPNDPFSLSNNAVLSTYVDRAGDLWAATHGAGLSKYSRTKKAFQHYARTLAYPNSLGNQSIRAIYEDEQGVLWIGGYDGLDKFDRKTGRITHYQHDPENPFSLPVNPVFVIYPDPAGAGKIFLIGLESEQGLLRFDRASGRFMIWPRDPATGQRLIRHLVFALHRDRGGMLWIGTNAGLFKFDEARQKMIRYTHDPNDPMSLSHNWILSLCEDSTGALWLGTNGGGVNRFDRNTGRFIHYRHDPRDPFSPGNDRIKSIYADRDGTVWFGTDGGGLNRFDRVRERFVSYTTKDGLPNDVIYGILEDDENNLWLSTNKGLSKFNPQTRTFRNYEASDGLQSNEFNTGAHFKSSSGEMFFGGINGVTAFFPDQIKDNPDVPPTVLTGFRKFNQPVKLDTAISEIKRIELSHDDAVFSFEFAALNFTAPGKNRYAYRLQGLHENWISLGTRREVTFTNLDPGEYVLQVKGSNNDGVWNETGLRLIIVIAPAFYQTKWFPALVLLVLGLTVYAGHRRRLQRLEANQRKLERLVAEKTRQLHQSEAELRLMTEQAPAVLWTTDTDLRFTLSVGAGLKTLGLQRNQVRGTTLFEYFSTNDEYFLPIAAHYHALRGKSAKYELEWGRHVFDCYVEPLYDVEGTIVGALGIAIDITVRKQMEAHLRNYTTELERTVEERTRQIQELEKLRGESEKLAATGRMAARIAHEVNNPLGVIQTAIRLISRAVPEQHRHYHYVGKVEKEIDRIARIVRQMLELHKPHQESPKEFRADELIKDLVILMKPEFDERRLELTLDVDQAAEKITLPENMLRQIIYNIVLNAVEASPEDGLVRIEATVAGNALEIAVSDEGPGIPETIKSRIFEPFFTTKSHSKTGGMGLGLSISKNLIEAIKGDITFDGKPGEGTVCRIVIPLDKN
jgi:PAS domain S-box-containing protein